MVNDGTGGGRVVSRLVDADESLNHQVVDTFRAVGHADLRWTEKVWAAVHDIPSGYQIVFGLGKYTNRGVLDGFGGIALGNDQWAVRASRAIDDRPDGAIGPLRYEVIEPLQSVRFVLEPDGCSDFAFDVVMQGWVPPGLEERWPSHRQRGGLAGDVLRYHQAGSAHGWLEHRGVRRELAAASCPAFRDHSWGVRLGVGLPADGVAPEGAPRARYRLWAPMRLQRDDGSRYGLFLSYLREQFDDDSVNVLFDGAEELPSGSRNRFMMLAPELRFDPITRRCRGGVLRVVDHRNNARPITLTEVRDTGFHIGMGGYYGGADQDHYLGQWHGAAWRDQVEALGTDTPETVSRVHQTRDALFAVADPAGGGVGYASIETILTGSFDDLGVVGSD